MRMVSPPEAPSGLASEPAASLPAAGASPALSVSVAMSSTDPLPVAGPRAPAPGTAADGVAPGATPAVVRAGSRAWRPLAVGVLAAALAVGTLAACGDDGPKPTGNPPRCPAGYVLDVDDEDGTLECDKEEKSGSSGSGKSRTRSGGSSGKRK